MHVSLLLSATAASNSLTINHSFAFTYHNHSGNFNLRGSFTLLISSVKSTPPQLCAWRLHHCSLPSEHQISWTEISLSRLKALAITYEACSDSVSALPPPLCIIKYSPGNPCPNRSCWPMSSDQNNSEQNNLRGGAACPRLAILAIIAGPNNHFRIVVRVYTCSASE